MPSIHTEILVDAAPERVWDAVRDVGALHTRLVPGFVTHVELLPDVAPPVRLVTFATGTVLREVIVDLDDARRRLVWTIESEAVRHHNGALQVFATEAGGSRVTWIADVLPDETATAFAPLMAQGLARMKAHLEGRA